MEELSSRMFVNRKTLSKLEKGDPGFSLSVYASALGIKEGSDDWLDFCDLAAISAGKIPTDIVSDKELLPAVPVLFRSIRKEGIEKEKIQELLETIKKELR